MPPDSSTPLSDEQISALVSARRKLLRLRALRRLSSSLRTADAELNRFPATSVRLALPGPSTSLLYGPLFDALVAPSADSGVPADDQPARPNAAGVRPGSGGAIQIVRLNPLPVAIGARGVTRLAAAWRRLPWPVIRERTLLLLETCALVGLLVIVTGSFSGLGNMSPDTAGAAQITVPTPAPLAQQEEELPGASAPPATGAEMPLPLRSLVRGNVATPIPIPTPGPQAATRIVIPAIEVDSVIVEGDSWELLKKGVGHHVGTANPGERGNAVFAGHVDVYGEVFRRLVELKPGDAVTLFTGQRQFRYEIRRVRIVEPKETSVMATTPDATLTLITCYPYRVDTHRLIVIATLTE